MTSRLGGGRDRPPRRYEDGGAGSGGSKRGTNPPSRHLWVGNLAEGVSEEEVTSEFSRFGELESAAFQPGRSYGFLNFRDPEDAIAALGSLQGFPIAGKPLRVEFAKADKSSAISRDKDHVKHQDELNSAPRESPFSQRQSRVRDASPDQLHFGKSKTSGESAEPSEVLWIGFPAQLKVDDVILRKAFSPFGDIEKITAFPGRSYAFVRFRSISSACRAKETLQGKLFGNPRVHICFARTEGGVSNARRAPLSPQSKSGGRSGAFESFRQDSRPGNFPADSNVRSHFHRDLDFEDPEMYGFNRKSPLLAGGEEMYDNWRYEEDFRQPQDMYERHGSPNPVMGIQFRDTSHNFPDRGQLYEEPWDLPDDPYLFRESKKPKISPYHSAQQLPEYPSSDPNNERRQYPREFSELPRSAAFDKNFDHRPLGHKRMHERSTDVPPPRGGRSDHWNASFDDFQAGSASRRADERKRYTPEPEHLPIKLWKWEGTIAKGGTPVCRARCFPVGKAMGFMLPEFLDCTARTGLDMLAKHYYQAASAWVVFFVPDDADIDYYNEFMHYLEEKQRAAVAKLDDRTTLFLVPPSDFSEKVLKVPGSLSISGVVLRLENPGPYSGSLHQNERRDSDLLARPGDTSYMKSSVPFNSFHSSASFAGNSPSPPKFSGATHPVGRTSDSFYENRHDYSRYNWDSSPERPPQHPRKQTLPSRDPDWSPYHQQGRPLAPNDAGDPIREHHSFMPRAGHENNSAPYGGLESRTPGPSSMTMSGLQPQQLAQLASTLLGQQGQSGSAANVPANNYGNINVPNQSDGYHRPTQAYGLQNSLPSSDIPSPLMTQSRPLPHEQTSNMNPSSSIHREILQPGPSAYTTGTAEEADADPQKRLQATLQLAAALLQQIQQGKGT